MGTLESSGNPDEMGCCISPGSVLFVMIKTTLSG